MPNHCWNVLSVSGPEALIDEFLGESRKAFDEFGLGEPGEVDDVFTFLAFVPHPESGVLKGSTGFGSFVLDGGVWRSTVLSREEAERDGFEFYSGAYAKDLSGNVFTKPEIEEKGLVDWFSWNIENWGTKWDAYDVDVERFSPNHCEISFLSAWSPPEPVVIEIQKQFPGLSIGLSFEEVGLGFRGEVTPDGSVFTEDIEGAFVA